VDDDKVIGRSLGARSSQGTSEWGRCSETTERWVMLQKAPMPHKAVQEMVGSREAIEGTPRPHVAVRGRVAQRTSRPHMAVRGRTSQAGTREVGNGGTIVVDIGSRSRNTSSSVREAAGEEEKGNPTHQKRCDER
jgi:hypothetical protein